MLQKYPDIKILKLFLDESYAEMYLREVSKIAGTGLGNIKKHWIG
jgi:hypothetical protein